MTDKFRISIRVKLVMALIIALALAILVFYLVYEFGLFLVWRYHLGEASKQERAEEYVAEFQDYVTKNKLTIGDIEKISSWTADRYVDLIIYKDSALVYAPDWFEDFNSSGIESGELDGELETELSSVNEGGEEVSESMTDNEYSSENGDESSSETEVGTDRSFYENWFSGDRGFEQYLTEEALNKYQAALGDALGENGMRHPVYFVDGTLIVAVADFSEEMMNNAVFAISITVSLLLVVIIMICFFGSITRRIGLLQKDVRMIEQGDLGRQIKQKGRDEIALLAEDVGSMRDAIVDDMTRERRAWEANAGLITAMSHDIRTPLTVLLGYIDLIEMQSHGEISSEYIGACRENALRLKNLSDDMFSYFLAFGRSESKADMTSVDVRSLTSHIVSEYHILLSENGYKLESFGEIPELSVRLDERYFRRIMDNVFSNVIKYADKGHPIKLGSVCDGERLILSCENKIRSDKDIPESNGIGLKTCSRMMDEMGGAFDVEEKDGSFTVRIAIPVEKKND